MSDKPREWPNLMKEIRDRSAEEAMCGIRLLEPLVMAERTFTETETIRRTALALNCLQNIVRLLERAGAQTMPAEHRFERRG